MASQPPRIVNTSQQATQGAASGSSIGDRAVGWLSENRRALLLAAGVIVVAGGGYYYYASQQPPPPAGKRGKKVRRRPQSKPASPKVSETEGEQSSAPAAPADLEKGVVDKPAAIVEDDSEGELVRISVWSPFNGLPADPLALTSDEITALSTAVCGTTRAHVDGAEASAQRRKEIAGQLKSRGNRAYQLRSHQEAYKLYTKAIECDEQAVFYSNRAACSLVYSQSLGDAEPCIQVRPTSATCRALSTTARTR
jgi:import receptor subunit TOM70